MGCVASLEHKREQKSFHFQIGFLGMNGTACRTWVVPFATLQRWKVDQASFNTAALNSPESYPAETHFMDPPQS